MISTKAGKKIYMKSSITMKYMILFQISPFPFHVQYTLGLAQ